ncbi:hypothetical protein PBRA_006967 [Plasmodiophora brassicae]|nr:hypothetical protein PBRA_006967 [Plasmodiophora brassicae]
MPFVAVVWTVVSLGIGHSLPLPVNQAAASHCTLSRVAPDPSVMKQLVFAIKNRSVKDLETMLEAVSDPGSPSYGRYISLSELGNMTYNAEAYDAVMGWLTDQNVTDIKETVNRDFVTVNVPVGAAAEMLGTAFHTTICPNGRFVTAPNFTMPQALEEYVDFIGGTWHRASWQKHVQVHPNAANGPVLNGSVTPALLNSFYKIVSNGAQGTSGSLFEALGQSYSPADLTRFQTTFNLTPQGINTVIGPNNPNACVADPNACGEANLDVQFFMAVAQQTDTTFWSIDANAPDPFLSWVIAVANDANPPLVHSISYGGAEQGEPNGARFNQELMKLGLRGVTVVVSSGDDGAHSPALRQNPAQCGLVASFPASSPYVVAVGATQGPESGQAEVSCSSQTGGIITSGGGFSTLFAQPSYQKQAVQAFLNKVPAAAQSPVASGRAYPDVSLMGFNYVIVDGAQALQVSGTSASAPVFAGMLALVNARRAQAGKPPVGFVNPLLYSLQATTQARVYNDIAQGSNNCAAGVAPNINCCTSGYTATTGWDPVTGLGSVNFDAFLAAAANA